MLHVHRADRADALVGGLGELIAKAPTDPFAAEVVCVPTRGVERWLTQSLATRLGVTPGRRDGVVANVNFPSPREITEGAVAAACGVDPATDPWAGRRLIWTVLEVVDAHLSEPWLTTLMDHLRDSAEGGGGGGWGPTDGDGERPGAGDGAGKGSGPDAARPRRLAAVRHLARLFDRYALHRPEMLGRWAAGEDVDGSGRALPAQTAWQAELWRHVRARSEGPDPAARLVEATATITRDPKVLDLPPRLSIFGLTRLPTAHLQTLRAIATARDVHLFLLHPSPPLWDRVAATLGQGARPRRRAEDQTATLPRSRLLSSWGRDVRELQLLLGPPAGREDHPPEQDPEHAPPPHNLLARIQADIRADRHAPGPPLPGHADARPALAAEDRSVELHSCHGRSRQVEVLRDAILHALRESPEMEPRDVIVMCPDIETYSPLIHATFGVSDTATTGDEHPDGPPDDHDKADGPTPPDLRVRLADRSLRQTNAVLGTVSRLLELADQRMTASQVLDFADRAPVRRRFGLDDADLARFEDWVAATGVRWGLDAAHRAPFKLDALGHNTWRSGFDRLLTGVTMTEDEQRLIADVLPLDDVESGAIDLVGRLAELLDRLHVTVERFGTPRPIDGWAAELARAADLLTAPGRREEWQRAELERLLAELVSDASANRPPPATAEPGGVRSRVAAPGPAGVRPPAGPGPAGVRPPAGPGPAEVRPCAAPLELAEIRDLLAERLRGRPTRANFRTGHLTFCTLAPMRSVPHRVVCLLGLDDTVFPRKAPRDGDDLIVADPHVGDHDGRTEDRQLLLDALLAAGDRLIITYTGNDERTNAPSAPAVPVGELLDVVDRTVRTGQGRARDAITVRHPLQPFDPANFTPDALTAGSPFSFDHVTLQGARALTGPRAGPAPFLEGPLDPPQARVVELEDLVRFVEHPARAFLRRRLGVRLADYSDELEDTLPVDLDPLEQWAVGDRMLRARLAGHDIEKTVAAERARGALPPGKLADATLSSVRHKVEAVVAAAARALAAGHPHATLDARFELPEGRILGGTVGVHGDQLQHVVYSRVGPKHRLAAWVRLLALTATWPERPLEAVTVGRARSGGPRDATVTVARIPPLGLDADDRRASALEKIGVLLDLFDRGLREPPPLACATSAAYAHAAGAGRNAVAAGRRAWESEYRFVKEDQDLEHRLLLGGVLTFEQLLEPPARADEAGPGWDAGEPARFGRWAVRLWSGLLACEELSDR